MISTRDQAFPPRTFEETMLYYLKSKKGIGSID